MAKALRVQNHILEDDTAALVLHHNASLQGIPQDLDLAPSLAESSFWRVRPSIESTGTGYPLSPRKDPLQTRSPCHSCCYLLRWLPRHPRKRPCTQRDGQRVPRLLPLPGPLQLRSCSPRECRLLTPKRRPLEANSPAKTCK